MKKIFLTLILVSTTACAGSPIIFQGDSALFLKGSMNIPQVTTPTTPASGYDKLYIKSGDKLYIKDSSGTETLIGPTASGSYVTNSVYVDGGSVGTACGSSPCTIGQQSGSWVTSVTRVSAGLYNNSITGYSALPTCVPATDGINNVVCGVQWNASSSSTVQVRCRDASGNNTDTAYSMICHGTP